MKRNKASDDSVSNCDEMYKNHENLYMKAIENIIDDICASKKSTFNKSLTLIGLSKHILVMECVMSHSLADNKQVSKVSQREIFYHLKDIFSTQEQCNTVIRNVARYLGSSRVGLGIIASSRCRLAGSLVIKDENNIIKDFKLSSTYHNGCGIHGSSQLDKWEIFAPDARAILVIEKEGVFHNLCTSRFFDRIPSIIVTASGFPDVMTRRLLSTLIRKLKLPVFAVVDWNPSGLAIIGAYMQGGRCTGFENIEIGLIPVTYLGIYREDVEPLQTMTEPTLSNSSFTKRDRAIANGLIQQEWVKNDARMLQELLFMKEIETKYEIQDTIHSVNCKLLSILQTKLRFSLLNH